VFKRIQHRLLVVQFDFSHTTLPNATFHLFLNEMHDGFHAGSTIHAVSSAYPPCRGKLHLLVAREIVCHGLVVVSTYRLVMSVIG
jgi:hypothetical protein